ncbi:MAG: dockerin type I domain-containing protein [Planctomycetota bacterium]
MSGTRAGVAGALAVIGICGSAVAESDQRRGVYDLAEMASHRAPGACSIADAPEAVRAANAARLAANNPAINEQDFARVADHIDRESFHLLTPRQRDIFVYMVDNKDEVVGKGHMCFAPDTPLRVVQAFDRLLQGASFNQIDRWPSTAVQAGPLAQGDPTTLTYSYAPDGTFVPNLIGVSGTNDLNSWLDGIYSGNTAAWQAEFDGAFDDWEVLIGTDYIFEPNDDGSQLNTLPGEVGMRGDVRIASIFIDGNSGTLAYNNFPPDGDMVFDSGDSFYNNAPTSPLGFRNVIRHEHGHGLGMLHVCPINQTILMEPFISFAFDGPQLDDVLNGQRHYGDSYEDNDSPDMAFGLGTLSGPELRADIASTDSQTDVDYYAFTVNAPTAVAVTATPFGLTYESVQQDAACSGGIFFDSLNISDLAVEIIAPDGVTVLASSNVAPIGAAETANATLLSPGTYFAKVIPTGTIDNVQLYDLTVTIDGAPGFLPASAAINGSLNTQVGAGSQFSFEFEVFENDELVDPASVRVLFSYDDSVPFEEGLIESLGGGQFRATLPGAKCPAMPRVFVEFVGSTSGVLTLPPAGASGPLLFSIDSQVVIASENFETDGGFTVTNDASLTDGGWDRGVPANGFRGDPPVDFDGSGSCWLTDNVAGNSDVDGGTTTLTSPAYDLSRGGTISYAYWIDDGPGNLVGDALTVQVATDSAGTNWQTVRIHDNALPDWEQTFITIDGALASSTVRIRFLATDGDPQGVVEAAIDALVVSANRCDAAAGTDCNNNFALDDDEIALGLAEDCQPNGIIDSCDIDGGEPDDNMNGIPDSCEVIGSCPGDVNGDGETTTGDITLTVSNLGAGSPGAQGTPGDANGDGVTTTSDITLIVSNLGCMVP